MNCVEVTRDGDIVATLKFKGMPMNQLGPATFPIEGRMLNYECDPPGAISDETIREIGKDVAQNRVVGQAGEESEFRWYGY